MGKFLAATACAVLAAFSGTSLRAETAVSIDYRFVERPAQLPATFAAPAGASLRFIALTAIDGERVDGALWQPASKTAADTTLVIGTKSRSELYLIPGVSTGADTCEPMLPASKV